MKTGIELIAEERKRQIEVEGWDEKHDDNHLAFSLSTAGACYALDFIASKPIKINSNFQTLNDVLDYVWPFDGEWWKPTPEDPVRQLTKAGALIAAEIDRLQRQK